MNNVCRICHTPFDDALHRDCGGDCLLCMAESGDPDCAVAAVPLLHNMLLNNAGLHPREPTYGQLKIRLEQARETIESQRLMLLNCKR